MGCLVAAFGILGCVQVRTAGLRGISKGRWAWSALTTEYRKMTSQREITCAGVPARPAGRRAKHPDTGRYTFECHAKISNRTLECRSGCRTSRPVDAGTPRNACVRASYVAPGGEPKNFPHGASSPRAHRDRRVETGRLTARQADTCPTGSSARASVRY